LKYERLFCTITILTTKRGHVVKEDAERKDRMQINVETFLNLGIDLKEGIIHVESKKALDIDPLHIIGLLILRQGSVPVSS
jgi:hypothetical protein